MRIFYFGFNGHPLGQGNQKKTSFAHGIFFES